MKLYKLSLALLSILTLGVFTSCDDDDTKVAKAVMVSAPTIFFDGIGADPQVVTVYSDAPWVADVPEWVTISPETGTGTTDVTISVTDNLREGTLDNPRRATLVFHGNTKASRYEVTVRQLGDNYRDCPVMAVKDIVSAADETYLEGKNMLVAGKFDGGYMVSDDNGASNVFVATAKAAAVGDKVNIKAQKMTDDRGLAVANADEFTVTSSGNAVTYPIPVDITANVDKYASNARAYVTVSGVLVGDILSVTDASNKVAVVNNTEIDLAALNGHFVELTGYFAGIATPYVNLQVVSTVDNGEAQITYWTEDFEWLAPWAAIGNGSACGSTVEEDNPDANAPQLPTPVIDGVSGLKAMENKGYEFLRVCDPSKKIGECIYLQTNYLKFGKTAYQAGITFPSITEVPEDHTNLYFEFEWCPMRQGSGKIDPVHLIVIVKNGDAETTYEIPTHGWANDHKLEWIKATVDLSNETFDKDTRITIRQTEWPAATANRWFLDNVRVYSKIG